MWPTDWVNFPFFLKMSNQFCPGVGDKRDQNVLAFRFSNLLVDKAPSQKADSQNYSIIKIRSLIGKGLELVWVGFFTSIYDRVKYQWNKHLFSPHSVVSGSSTSPLQKV